MPSARHRTRRTSSGAQVLVLALLLLASAPAARAQDLDGDGWSVADGDCCDVPTGICTRPELVNPGAYDDPTNGIDDDCDGIIDNPAPATCSTGTVFGAPAGLLAAAMDICQQTPASPPLSGRTWGLIEASLLSADGLGVPNPVQVSVKTGFGASIVPQTNATMAVLSTGTARDAADPGWISPTPGLADSTNVVGAPAAWLAANGGMYFQFPCLRPVNPVYDSVLLRLRIRVPTNAQGFSLRYRFFSSEYPSTCNAYNDHFLCLVSSGAPGYPADRNILFDSLAHHVTGQTAFFEVCTGCVDGSGELIGTGYDPADDAGTRWLASDAPVVPGEEITLDFYLWDCTDGLYDSLALLDNFHWQLTPQDPPLAVADVRGARELALRTSPNPFASSGVLEFDLPAASHVVLEIFDAGGRRVRGLVDRDYASGANRISWDGRNDEGHAVAAGTYFARIAAGDRQLVRRLTLRK